MNLIYNIINQETKYKLLYEHVNSNSIRSAIQFLQYYVV